MRHHLRSLGPAWPSITRLTGLTSGAAAYALAQRAPAPCLVVVPRTSDASRLVQALRFHTGGAVPCLLLPADDVRPYDGQSPHPDVVRQRIQSVVALTRGEPCFVVASATALMHRVLASDAIRTLSRTLAPGDEIDRMHFVRDLVIHGYHSTHQVVEPGTVAGRGAVVDLWPIGAARPARIEFFDDEIDDIRRLDPASQRSTESLPSITVPPAREAVPTPAALTRAAEGTARVVDIIGGGQATRRRVLESLRNHLWFPAAEDYLAVLQPLANVWDLTQNRVVVEPAEVLHQVATFAEAVTQRWEAQRPEHRPVALPADRYSNPDDLEVAIEQAQQITLLDTSGTGDSQAPDLGTRPNKDLLAGAKDLAPVVGHLDAWLNDGWQVALVCDSRTRAERITALFAPHGLMPVPTEAGELRPPGTLSLWVGSLPEGFHSPADHLAILTADEIFGAKVRSQRAPKTLREATLGSVSELRIGQLVVHVRHGVGRFEHLKRIELDGLIQEFAEVHYRAGDRLYLPVTRLDELYRYRSIGKAKPRLDKLGGETWEKRKAKVRDRVLRMAHDLLQMHAMRTITPGHAYAGRPPEYQQFVETFPFVETPDQLAAIDEVLEDLARPEPMDRLVVGDVGFGKTEVAMRAAMRVVLEGHQVALLCPTTVLSFQHFETFRQRFADLPMRIELLSAFRSAADRRAVLADTASGAVDILIGTTALLSQDLRFHHLGLVVVDEEHRYGVQQKHKLKQLTSRESGTPVDTLSMSATPIPRTLHMALSGLRNVSLITTPPPDRRAIQTRIVPFDGDRVREDIQAELGRGGQVFFVHNRVQSIDSVARYLRKLVPEATFAVAHGQMDKRQLERVLVDFIRRKTHVLVCTTIIESGVDIPSVNTMIVNRADRLGMAQLYQLRGRVGRSHVQARCTLLMPADHRISRTAMLRLRALQDHSDLGSGFAIATRDMEVRGSGTLLGEAQHGHIQAVGFDTYIELLEEAIAAAKGELSRTRLDPEVDVPVPTFISETWIPELDERLSAYRTLSMSRTTDQVRSVLGQWEDRYGEPPPEVLNLGWAAETRVRCRNLGIAAVRWKKVRVFLDFDPTTPVDRSRIVALVTRLPERFSLAPLPGADAAEGAGGRIIVRFTPEEGAWPFRFLHWVFRQLEAEPD